ncbi:Protein of unknown function DUF3425 [Penicillium crustosum]|uniref:Protein of unknown function DUF3425 n=1 Tax=Penicillium crustosum TaxID=36656 RepID=UPI002390974A|nr:Protein of unknown function DUF3425 [Penicillium crustosum]KAJ5393479.1 Protein of unknown function DUF3425 [Penicillium crustosum]
MDPGPKQPVRRRTSKQLERKRELDKQAQRIKRETDKDRLVQIQADVQKIQQQMDSLQKTMAMILDGMNTLHSTHPSAHLSQSSVMSLPADRSTPQDGRIIGTRGDSSSSSSPSSLTSNLAHGGQAPPKLYGDTDRSLLAVDCSVVSRELNHSPVAVGSLPENNDSCSPYAQDSVQLVASALHPSETGANKTTLDAHRQTQEFSNREVISVHDSKAPTTIYAHIDTSPPTIFRYRGVTLPFCHCQPRVHSSYADCFEHTVYDAVIKAHNQPQAPPVPLSPSLPDLLFVGEGDNVVSRILFKMLKREGLCGMDDVPEWFRPTEVQNNTPHQIFTDFMPFPQLRNAMVSGSVEYTREEFDIDYGRSVSINWPSSKPLLVRNDSLDVVLNPEFEPHVLNYSNWSLNEGFALKYPHMATMATIR